MDTAAGEGLRRRRTGGRAGHERHLLPQQRPWAQPRMRYAPDRGRSPPTSSSRSTSRRCASCPRSGWTSSTPMRARCCKAAGAETDARYAARPVRPGHGHRDDQDGAVVVHAARPEPRARPPARRRLGGVRDGRQPAERRGPRPRPAHRQPRGLPEPAAAGPAAQRRPLPVRATRSSRSTSTTGCATCTRRTTP